MHIKIVGFKCHLDTSFTFDNYSIVILKGDSGAGKSTVLQAIYWVLYGSMRGIYNNTGKIKTCNVTLKINQLLIYRQKRPEVLKVTVLEPKKETYQDEETQKIILKGLRNPSWESIQKGVSLNIFPQPIN